MNWKKLTLKKSNLQSLRTVFITDLKKQKMRILLFILFLTTTLKLSSQTYNTEARGSLKLSNYALKCKYKDRKLEFNLVDNTPTYTLFYPDGEIIFMLENSIVTKISFLFHSEETYKLFIRNNSMYWFEISNGQWQDNRYSHISIFSDVAENSISMIIIRLNN